MGTVSGACRPLTPVRALPISHCWKRWLVLACGQHWHCGCDPGLHAVRRAPAHLPRGPEGQHGVDAPSARPSRKLL